MKYVVYTFQFTPLVEVRQLDLFEPTLQVRDEIMAHKLEYFEEALSSAKFHHYGRTYENSVRMHRDSIMIMRLANRKSFVREKNFQVLKDEDEPSCGVIIDYRPGHQVIAIEEASRAFNNTDTVRNILEKSLNDLLCKHRLYISLKRQNLASEFWDYVKQYRGRINEVRFTYHYPNLGRASEKMKELLGDTSKVVNSTESEIVFKGKSLELDEKNEDLQDYTNDSENSGIPISLKIQGVKKTIKTGKRPKSFELEELDFQGDPMAYSKLLDTLNHGL